MGERERHASHRVRGRGAALHPSYGEGEVGEGEHCTREKGRVERSIERGTN